MLIASDTDNELEMMMRERLPMAPLLRFKMNRVRHVPGEQLRVDVTPGVIGKKERWWPAAVLRDRSGSYIAE